jgi:uncharacterized protein (TIGR00725 family)
MSAAAGSGQGYARSPHIGVVGPSDADPQTYAHAVEVGRLLALHGAIVVCGGLGGVMEAAARGASVAGGTSLGILPGHDRAEANPYLTTAVASGLGELRNGLLVSISDALVAVGGSWGTMSEVALAIRLGKPVASLGGWSVADSDGAPVKGPRDADCALAAVELVLHALVSR